MKNALFIILALSNFVFADNALQLTKKLSIQLTTTNDIKFTKINTPATSNTGSANETTRIDLTYKGLGCLNKLGPVSFKTVESSKKIKVYVTSYIIINSDTLKAMCVRSPEGQAEIYVNSNGKPIEVIQSTDLAESRTF